MRVAVARTALRHVLQQLLARLVESRALFALDREAVVVRRHGAPSGSVAAPAPQ
jgi:hypothetical protein